MEKQKKNIITRKDVSKELCFYNKADIRYSLVLCCVFFICFVLLFGLTLGILSDLESLMLKIIFAFIFGILELVPTFMAALPLRKAVAEKKMLSNDEFDIVTQVVSHKSEKFTRRYVRKFLHFAGFKSAAVNNTTFQLSSLGDEFYIVYYKGNSSIKLLYPLKMYEYKNI